MVRDSLRATEHLLRAPGALVLVDGYNVAKLGWPDRRRWPSSGSGCSTSSRTSARRFGSDVTVVFDGADVVGAHADPPTSGRGRLLAGRRHRRRRDPIDRGRGRRRERPVVVVTNDQAVRRSVAAAGANLISSDAFLALARR